MKNRHLVALTLAALAVILSSCGPRPVASGLVLWSPDEEALPTGSVIDIYGELRIAKKYTYAPLGTDDYGEIQSWRVRRFDKRADAEAAAAEYLDWAPTLAVVRPLNPGGDSVPLPIRSDATTASTAIYRLEDGQVIKIIGRHPDPVVRNDGTHYWYRVLTDDGTEGWCFDLRLRIFDFGEQIAEEAQTHPLMEWFFRTVYRPEYFWLMIREQRVDLDRFNPAYGLFPDPAEKTVYLNTEDTSQVFTYDQVIQSNQRRFRFLGSSLEVLFLGDTVINVQYVKEGEETVEKFLALAEDVNAVIAAEQDRRDQVFEGLYTRGNLLKSSIYGEIRLSEEGAFEWEGYDRLTPFALPPQSGATGTIGFNRFTSLELSRAFDGMITFRFDANGAEAHFLFAYSGNGIQLTWVPEELMTEGVVSEPPPSPTVAFFGFESAGE
jgi:hypothetical protein